MTTNLTTADRSADAKTALLDALKRAHKIETYCNGNVSIDGEILDKGPFEATAMSWDGTADGLEDLGWEMAADAMRDEEAPCHVCIPLTPSDMRSAVAESAHPDSDPDDYEAAYRGALEWIGERANIEIDTPADGPANNSDLAQEVWQLAHDMMWWDGSAWQWDDDRAHAHDRADRIRNQ